MRSFHPRLKVDVGRGPGKGLGPRLFVGLASAAPLPLTSSQASKLGIFDSFDVDLNPAQVRFFFRVNCAAYRWCWRRGWVVRLVNPGTYSSAKYCCYAGIFISRHMDLLVGGGFESRRLIFGDSAGVREIGASVWKGTYCDGFLLILTPKCMHACVCVCACCSADGSRGSVAQGDHQHGGPLRDSPPDDQHASERPGEVSLSGEKTRHKHA